MKFWCVYNCGQKWLSQGKKGSELARTLWKLYHASFMHHNYALWIWINSSLCLTLWSIVLFFYVYIYVCVCVCSFVLCISPFSAQCTHLITYLWFMWRWAAKEGLKSNPTSQKELGNKSVCGWSVSFVLWKRCRWFMWEWGREGEVASWRRGNKGSWGQKLEFCRGKSMLDVLCLKHIYSLWYLMCWVNPPSARLWKYIIYPQVDHPWAPFSALAMFLIVKSYESCGCGDRWLRRCPQTSGQVCSKHCSINNHQWEGQNPQWGWTNWWIRHECHSHSLFWHCSPFTWKRRKMY